MEQNKYLIPLSILIGAVLISATVVYTQTQKNNALNNAPIAASQKTIAIPAVSETDHVRGSRDAQVFLIEYSDTECPFCQRFHTTMQRLMDTYSTDGSIAWVYRHFPIAQLHPKAPKQAEAMECVAKLGGEEAFWKYTDIIYERTPSNNGLDHAFLPVWAEEVGVDKGAFETCLNSGEFTEKITTSFNEARTLGAQGTPYTVLVPTKKISAGVIKNLNNIFVAAATQMQIAPDRLGTVTQDGKVVLNGALPYEFIEQLIKALVS